MGKASLSFPLHELRVGTVSAGGSGLSGLLVSLLERAYSQPATEGHSRSGLEQRQGPSPGFPYHHPLWVIRLVVF